MQRALTRSIRPDAEVGAYKKIYHLLLEPIAELQTALFRLTLAARERVSFLPMVNCGRFTVITVLYLTTFRLATNNTITNKRDEAVEAVVKGTEQVCRWAHRSVGRWLV